MSNLPNFTKVENTLRSMIDSVITKLGHEVSNYSVVINQNQSLGDYSTNVAHVLAKKTGISPATLAQKIAGYMKNHEVSDTVKEIVAEKNGFINFWVSDQLLSDTLSYIFYNDLPFHGMAADDNNIYVVEYSSPNMVKPFTVGYLRSTIVGDSVANILNYVGKKVIRDNHLGDWGTQFGKLLCAIRTWSSIEMVESLEDSYSELIRLYLKFVKEETLDQELSKRATVEYQELENGNPESLEIWLRVRKILIRGIDKIYNRLGINFDVLSFESFFVKEAQDLVKSPLLFEMTEVSDGAIVVHFDTLPTLVLRKRDGTTLYPLREIACDLNRKQKYGENLVIINEVGNDQKVYFEQIFSIEERIGLFKQGQRIHLQHGMYRLDGIKMVSEKGNYVLLDDILDLAKNAVIDRFPNISDSDAEIIGQAAIRFNDLSNPRQSDVVFDMNILNNMGKGTGPYLQQAVSIARAIIKKCSGHQDIPLSPSFVEGEREIVRHLQKSFKYIKDSQIGLSPHYIAIFSSKLAFLYNQYLAHIQDGGSSVNTRLISHCTEKMLDVCLKLLGIGVPNEAQKASLK